MWCIALARGEFQEISDMVWVSRPRD